MTQSLDAVLAHNVSSRSAQNPSATADSEPTISISIAIAPGELVDRITILELKAQNITEAAKKSHIYAELRSMRRQLQRLPTSAELDRLVQELRRVNSLLWETEEILREKECERCFDKEFITLARSVYLNNDHRTHVKNQINGLLSCRMREVKSYLD